MDLINMFSAVSNDPLILFFGDILKNDLAKDIVKIIFIFYYVRKLFKQHFSDVKLELSNINETLKDHSKTMQKIEENHSVRIEKLESAVFNNETTNNKG